MATGFLWNHFEPTPGVWDSDNEQAMHAYVDLSRSYGMAPIALSNNVSRPALTGCTVDTDREVRPVMQPRYKEARFQKKRIWNVYWKNITGIKT